MRSIDKTAIKNLLIFQIFNVFEEVQKNDLSN